MSLLQFYIVKGGGNTPGGDGTTTATSGPNRAFENAADAETALDNAYDGDYVIIDASTPDSTPDTSLLTFNGATFADPSVDYIEFRGNCGAVWNEANYSLQQADGVAVTIWDDAIRLNHLQIRTHTVTANRNTISIAAISSSNHFEISNCIIRSHTNDSYTGAGIQTGDADISDILIWNNLIYDGSAYANYGNSGIYQQSCTTSFIYYNTIINFAGSLYISTGNANCKNNVLAGSLLNNVFIGGSGSVTGSDYNMSDDTSDTGGAHDDTEVTFTFEDADNDDYRLASGDTGAQGKGVDVSGDSDLPVSDDILGTTRDGSTPDCGFFEIDAGGSPVTGTVSETESADSVQSVTAIFISLCSESETIDDNNSAIQTALASTSESESIGDNNSAAALLLSGISESESIGDTADANIVNLGAVVESAPINDTQSSVITAPVFVEETESIGENQSAVGVFAPSCSESEIIDDNNSAVSLLLSGVSESESIGDVTDAEASNLGSVEETTAANDIQSSVITAPVFVQETESIDSIQSAINIAPVSMSESNVISDTSNAGKLSSDSISESESIGDVSDSIIVSEAAVIESESIGDVCDGSIPATAGAVSEQTGISDNVSATVIYSASVIETSGSVDVIIGIGIFIAQVSESATIDDTQAVYEIESLATAAELLRAIVIENGIGVLRSLSPSGNWPVFVSHLPSSPDNAICIYDTSGIQEGRIQRSGESIGKPGWQVRVRSVEFRDGIDKIHEVAECFDGILRHSVVIDTNTYNVQAITQKTTILSLGQNRDEKRRYHFTLNGTITYI